MKIAIDLDGVVIMTMERWIDQFHPESKISDLQGWSSWNYVDTCYNKDQFFTELDHLEFEENRCFKYVDPYAKECIDKLIESGHEVYFLTTKMTQSSLLWTLKFLKECGLDHIPLFNTRNKLIFDYNVIVDDNPNMKSEIGHVHVLMDRPWNQHIDDRIRVKDLEEFYELVEGWRKS